MRFHAIHKLQSTCLFFPVCERRESFCANQGYGDASYLLRSGLERASIEMIAIKITVFTFSCSTFNQYSLPIDLRQPRPSLAVARVQPEGNGPRHEAQCARVVATERTFASSRPCW